MTLPHTGSSLSARLSAAEAAPGLRPPGGRRIVLATNIAGRHPAVPVVSSTPAPAQISAIPSASRFNAAGPSRSARWSTRRSAPAAAVASRTASASGCMPGTTTTPGPLHRTRILRTSLAAVHLQMVPASARGDQALPVRRPPIPGRSPTASAPPRTRRGRGRDTRRRRNSWTRIRRTLTRLCRSIRGWADLVRPIRLGCTRRVPSSSSPPCPSGSARERQRWKQAQADQRHAIHGRRIGLRGPT